jgi:hypothetical protein
MKFGLAVDERGCIWRGFFAKTTREDIYHSASLGDVGICMNCRDRVFAGWHCESTKDDICAACVRTPDRDKIFLIKVEKTEEQLGAMQTNFIKDPNYDPTKEDQA